MKTVIEMAREATLLDSRDDWNSVPDEYREAINAFAELARADEREACAQLAEKLTWADNKGVASSIRARSNT